MGYEATALEGGFDAWKEEYPLEATGSAAGARPGAAG